MSAAASQTAIPGEAYGELYFFLSYAHSAAASEQAREPDPLIPKFFDDLSATIRQVAGQPARRSVGFFDQRIAPGEDVRAKVSEALGSAQVFVPLYSPRYVASLAPLREQAAFRRRLETSRVSEPERHLLPVLWTPFVSWECPEEVERTWRIAPNDSDYRENGLRALSRLRSYRRSYERMTAWIAEQIVSTVRRAPLERSTPPNLDDVQAAGAAGPRFSVTLLSPRGDTTLPAVDRAAREQVWWRVDRGPSLAWVASFAAGIAERLGLVPDVAAFDDVADGFRNAPAIVVVDPWVVAERGANDVAARFAGLPGWVTPVVLDVPPGSPGAARGGQLVAELRAALADAPTLPVTSVHDMPEVSAHFPVLMAKSRRVFLRTVPVPSTENTGTRRPPRLGAEATGPARRPDE